MNNKQKAYINIKRIKDSDEYLIYVSYKSKNGIIQYMKGIVDQYNCKSLFYQARERIQIIEGMGIFEVHDLTKTTLTEWCDYVGITIGDLMDEYDRDTR